MKFNTFIRPRMSSPMSDYSRSSNDAREFEDHYKKSIIKSDPRLEFHQDVVQDFGESYERSYMLLNTFYAEAYRDMSYYLSNQWSLEELAYLNNQRRSAFTYNKSRRVINMVDGYQRKNRLATTIQPIEDSSEQTSEIFSDAIQYVMNYAGGYETISDAFKGSLITGMSFVSPYLDYRSDPVSGDIRYHLDDWNAVIMDPFFTKRSLEDCSFVARRKFLSRTEIMSLLPEKADIIESLPYGTRDDKFTYLPYARQWGAQKLLNYNEYWRTKWEVKEVLVDMITGETRNWDGDKKRLQLFRSIYPQVEVIKKPVRTVELGIIVEGQLLYYGKDPFGLDDYPFVPFLCVFEPSYDLFQWKIQGLQRIMRDPQTEVNKRRSKMVDLEDNQLASGWIAKENAVKNPTSLYKTGQGQVIFVKSDAQMTDIQRIQAPDIPQSMFQLQTEFDNDIMEVAGVNQELFGMSENDKIETAGILSKMRQSAGLVNLQGVFDGLRESQKLLGEKTLKLIQKNYTPEKIQMITKKEPTPEFYSQAFAKYNVVVEEGVLTDTQKQAQFAQLVSLKALGLPIPDDLIIKNSSLSNKKELTDILKAQAEQQNQMAQMQQQLEAEKMATAANTLNAKADSDRALAAERIAKIDLDKAINAERLARSEEDRTAGVLNLVKAAKELDGMDLEHLMQEIEILRSLTESQESKEKKEPAAKSAA